jgi:glutamine amidotransferase
MHNLEQTGFVEPILKVIAAGRPFLGICVGMQLLFTDSVEFGLYQGLNIIPGHVLRFPDQMTVAGEKLKVPQMGWNQLSFKRRPPVFEGIDDGSNVYFVHSYYVKPDDSSVIATTTDYGFEFCSSVWKDNVVATQFHPEKSQAIGLQILKNFAELS